MQETNKETANELAVLVTKDDLILTNRKLAALEVIDVLEKYEITVHDANYVFGIAKSRIESFAVKKSEPNVNEHRDLFEKRKDLLSTLHQYENVDNSLYRVG